jgi:hypothetical protein
MVNQVKVWGQTRARKGAVENWVQLWKAKRDLARSMDNQLILGGLQNITKVRQPGRYQQAKWKISRGKGRKTPGFGVRCGVSKMGNGAR